MSRITVAAVYDRRSEDCVELHALVFSLKVKTMLARRVGFVVALFLAGIGSARSDGKEPRVIVDLRAHRAEIRTVLLRHTPLGSSVASVLEFVSKQLERSGDAAVAVENQPAMGPAAEESRQRGVKRIRVYLGQYYDHPEVVFLAAPLMMQKEVSAQWSFDQHDHLLEIFVDKTNELY
jgi:hypothetical protein